MQTRLDGLCWVVMGQESVRLKDRGIGRGKGGVIEQF